MKTLSTIIIFFSALVLNVSAQTVGKTAITAPGIVGWGFPGVYPGQGIVFTASSALTINCVTVYPYAPVNGTADDINIGLEPVTVIGDSLIYGGQIQSTLAHVVGYTQSPLIPETITLNLQVPSAGTYFLMLDAFYIIYGFKYDSIPCAGCSYPYTGSGVTMIGSASQNHKLVTDRYYYFYNWSIGTDCVSAVDELTAEDNLSVFPNPATTLLTITTTSTQSSLIILFDICLRQIMEEKFNGSATLNIENLAKGVYLYEVKDEKEVVKRGKVVKE
jgi:hypothetical protein